MKANFSVEFLKFCFLLVFFIKFKNDLPYFLQLTPCKRR